MINNLDVSLEGVAQAGLACIEEVRATITALEAAGQVAVIIKSRRRPILLALNQHRRKIYLINQMLHLGDDLLRWGLQLPEVAECTTQELFSDLNQRNIAIAQLVIGASLNAQGLMLELFIPGDRLSSSNCIKVIDQDNASHGNIKIFEANKMQLDLPINIQEKSLEIFKLLWLRSSLGTANIHNLLIYNTSNEILLRT